MIEATRDEVLKDAEYFATELIRRLEHLAKTDGRNQQTWQRTAALTRRIRGVARHQADTARAREKQLARR